MIEPGPSLVCGVIYDHIFVEFAYVGRSGVLGVQSNLLSDKMVDSLFKVLRDLTFCSGQ